MNPTLLRRCRAAAALVFASVMSACGGGGEFSLGGQGSASVSGTAATGRPIADATVTLKDVAGRSATQTTRSDGSYRFDDVSGFVWPVVARVEGGTLACGSQAGCTPAPNTQRYVGVSLGSRATQNTLNLTPMSHAVVSSAAKFDANGLFELPIGLLLINPLDLIDASVNVLDWLIRLDPEALLPRNINFVNGPFVATPTDAHDAALDVLQFVFTTLLLDTPEFVLLVLTSPSGGATPAAPLYCDVAGQYAGSYSGTRQGHWSATIDAYTGLVAGSATNPAGGADVPGLGSVVRLGLGTQRASAVLGFAELAQFAGGIDAARVLSGVWSSATELGGTFTGQRGSVAAACR
ncbi:MAG: carboxypeptidase-like regulatory domain-containing protein [Burkholderiales bacterium]|nr:carboxypeptidase-like regulatory domain-containing protein [Burkholderiales bacterium]